MLVLRDRDAPTAAHCVEKLFRFATDAVALSDPQAQGMRSTAKEVSAIASTTRGQVCRRGHSSCAQPSVYQLELTTALDPATAAGGSAAPAGAAIWNPDTCITQDNSG